MATIPPYRFGVSEFTTKLWSFEEDIEDYAQLGVECIPAGGSSRLRHLPGLLEYLAERRSPQRHRRLWRPHLCGAAQRLVPLLRAIHDAGFRGAYSVEIFSGDVPDSLWQGDLAQLIRDNRVNFDIAWHAAFSEAGDIMNRSSGVLAEKLRNTLACYELARCHEGVFAGSDTR